MKIINKIEEEKTVLAKDAEVGKVYSFYGALVTPINVCPMHYVAENTSLCPFISIDGDFSTRLFAKNQDLEYVGELTLVIE